MRQPESARGTRHAFTVDVEEYFQVNAFEGVVSPDHWDSIPSRLSVGLNRLLDLLAAAGAKGTFFTLGWVAERQPALIRRIVSEGHELASHGYWHRRVVTQRAEVFREDVRRAKAALESVAGVPVLGYRAPSFSIVRESEWALAVLREEGYVYDSSRFPIRRAGYGSPHVPLDAHLVPTGSGSLLEVPMTVLQLGGQRIPASGGGWFRQLPLWATTRALRQAAERGSHGVFYIHPWELDRDQPRMPVGVLTRIRHYRGIADTARRLEMLLRDFRFDTIRSVHAARLQPLLEGSAHVG